MGKRFFILLVLIASLGVACGGETQVFDLQGGSEIGNPPDEYRQVTGFVPWAHDVELQGLSLGGVACSAGPIIVTDLSGKERSYLTESDCSFSFYVRTGEYYTIDLSLGNDTAIPLMFGKEMSLLSPYIKIEPSEAAVDFGNIRFEEIELGMIALPEYIPTIAIEIPLEIPIIEGPDIEDPTYNPFDEVPVQEEEPAFHPFENFQPPSLNAPQPIPPWSFPPRI